MNFELNLQTLVEGTVPQDLTPSSIHSLTHDIAEFLLSSNKSISLLNSLINIYRHEVPHTLENDKRWKIFTDSIEKLLPFNNQDDILKYISGIQQSPTRNMHSTFNDEMLGNHANLSLLQSNADYAESFENMDMYSDRRSYISSHKNFLNSSNNVGTTLERLTKPYYTKLIPQEDIIKFISYTLLATTSDMFPIRQNCISIPKNISNGDSGILHHIFEAGLLYQKLNSIVEQNKKSNISPMKKALLIQISLYLRNYTGYINTLVFNKVENSESTTKQVYYKLFEKIIELRYLYVLLKDFDETDGYQYLKKLNELKNHGDLLVRETSLLLFNNLLSFYSEYLIDWLTLGKVNLNLNEFFIKINKDVEFSIYVDEDKLPTFIPKHVSIEIYIIGKTYLYLQHYFKDIQWTNTFSKRYNLKYTKYSHNIDRLFFDTIHDQYTEIVNHTNELLLHKFYFRETIYLVRDILLMGKADFIDVLIMNSNDILLSPSDSLSSYELTRYLQDSVHHSSMNNLLNRCDNNTLINKLDARVLDLGHGSIGWDVFTLDYLLDEPLLKILNVNREGGRKEYLRIFNFLWRFKKNTFFHNTETSRSTMLIRELRKISNKDPLIRDIVSKFSKCNVLKSQVYQFNISLETHTFQNIIENNFKELSAVLGINDESMEDNVMDQNNTQSLSITKLSSGLVAPDGLLKPKGAAFKTDINPKINVLKNYNIDEIEKLHNEFLSNILNNKLLSSSSNDNGTYSGNAYSTSIILLLNTIFEFLTYYNALNDITYEVLIQLNLQNSPNEINLLLGRFNTVLRNIVRQYKNFREQKNLFLRDLKSDGDDELFRLQKILK
ncbi:hypothetical protein TPHA_0I01440 [Tetrapisispora phaffii CBS 4417]|uniref:Spindle pole body component n=1 Tax=Tetrapisispora phaffii (strain ATCC 24235 / CBS 4417 / NBRC 1672 / NRRL Y-8282 / UCD 70-5) TaxID=1071381 RepID=G8BXM2_TETPH|nr:hypothetical protein TPHA_0I01440 [Tetrapisispora phaffii CBS 4417]CCE64650.1 hypothetical protein TPHA_0I01440 [Tetrapisispora phaffii CBS 4417]